MPERAATVNYQGFDPEAQHLSTPQTSSGNDYLNVHAQPQTEVGQALEKTGGAVEGLGNKALDIANQQAGLANESAATNADAGFASKVGSIYGKYSTLTGDEAVAAAPQVKAAIQQAQQEAISGLSPAAARATQMLTARTAANRIIDVDTYAAQQQKQSVRMAGLNLVNVASNLDGPTATDDNRFGERVGDVKHGIGMQMQDQLEPHLHADDETGATSFKDTPEAQNTKAAYDQHVDNAVGQLWSNRITTIANLPTHGPIAANQVFQDNKDKIPPVAAATIQANLAPQVYNAHLNQAVTSGWQDAQRSYGEHLTNPPAANMDIADAIHKYGEGGGKTSPTSVDGAVGGWQILPATFKQYAKQGEDINNPADNETVGRRIVADLKEKYPNDPARVAVGYFSGPGNISPPGSAQPFINDAKDGNGTSVSQYVDKIVTRLGGQPGKPYASNEDGTLMTQADYMQTHKGEILQKWDDWAEKQMPGDLQFRNQVRERALQQISYASESQAANYRRDNSLVIKAINGDFTNGKPPASFAELQSIPSVKPIIDRVEAQDPRFSQGIEGMISRVNKPKGDAEELSYGSNYHQLRDDVWGGKVTNLTDLQHAASAGELTQKGYDYLAKQLPAEAKDPIKQQNENHANANTFAIVRNQITHGMPEDMIKMNPEVMKTISSADIALQNAIDERKSRNIPSSQYYDPQNKEWIGNDAKVFQLTQAQALAAKIQTGKQAVKPRAMGDILGEAMKFKDDPAKQAQLRQEAISAGYYDPNAPQVPMSQ